MRGIFKRVSCFILAVVMILQMSLPSYAWYIPESEQQKMRDSDGYQYYLAEFLAQYPLLTTHMNANMLHRELFEELDKTTGGLIKFSDFYRTLTGSPLSFIDKKSKLYEQILNELLEKNLQSEETQKQLNTTAEAVRIAMVQEVLQNQEGFRENFYENAEELANVLDIGMEFLTSAQEVEYFKINHASFFDKVKAVVGKELWENSDVYFGGIDAILATRNNLLEFCNGVAAYTAVVEYKSGVEEFLQLMKDNTTDQDLIKAIDNVLVKIECVTEHDIAKALRENEKDLYWGEIKNLTGIAWKLVLGVIGAGNDGGYLLTDIIYGTKKTESLHLLLEAELEIEDVVVQTLAECRAGYRGDYDTAIALNAGTKMMYGAYEYGLDIIEKYVTLINDIFFRGLYAEQEELVDKEMLDSYENLLLSNKLDETEEVQEIFERLLKLNRGMVANGRSVFVTMGEVFHEEYLSGNKYKLFLNQEYIPVEGISLELPGDTILYDPYNTYPTEVTIIPENATNQRVTYRSSNTDVIMIEKDGSLQMKGTGIAVITATSDDGLYEDRKVIAVEKEKAAVSEKYIQEIYSDAKNDYTQYYEKNKDGITLKSMVWYKSKEKGHYVSSSHDLEVYWGAYIIPAYIDGMPVTELDFNGQLPKEYFRAGAVEYYPIENNEELTAGTPGSYVVVLPPTVKRIADNCFADYSFDSCIELNEGLESIGERAFYNCALYGDWRYLGYVQSEDMFGNDIMGSVFVIPESVKHIGRSAFEEADFLYRGIDIKSSFASIPERCFYGIERCGGIAFRQEEGLKVIEKDAFGGECEISGLLYLPDSVEEIKDFAFENSSVQLYELPEKLQVIGKCAFANSDQVKLLEKDKTIPEKVKKIGEEAFFKSFISYGTKEVLEIPDSIQQIGAGAFSGNTIGISEVISYATEETIQYDGWIGNEAFKDCSSITQIVMPENITTIGEDIIAGCSAIVQFTLSQNTYHIAKQNLKGLEEKKFYVLTTAAEPKDADSLVLKNQDLPSEWFYNGGKVSLGRVDIPGAFAQNFNLGAFDDLVGEGKPKIDRLVIWGEVHGLTKGNKAKQWSDFVSGVVYALNENGVWTCMYRESSEVDKVEYSKGKFENPDDYYLNMKELEEDYPTVKVPVGAGESNGSWTEGTEEQKAFQFFKEVYLEQENSRYMRLNLSAKEESEKGKDYQVGDPAILKFEIPESWNGDTDRYAAYHIGTNSEIHRLQGSMEGNHFWALTYDAGYFALVELSKLEEVTTEVVEGVNRESSIDQEKAVSENAVPSGKPGEKLDDEKTQTLSKITIEDGMFTITLWVDSTKVTCITPTLTQEQHEVLSEKLKIQKSEDSENQKKVQVLEFNVSEKNQTVVMDTSELEASSEEMEEVELYAFSIKEGDKDDISLKKVKLKKDKDGTQVTFKEPGTYWVVAVEKGTPDYKMMWIILLVVLIFILNPRRKKKGRRKRV